MTLCIYYHISVLHGALHTLVGAAWLSRHGRAWRHGRAGQGMAEDQDTGQLKSGHVMAAGVTMLRR